MENIINYYYNITIENIIKQNDNLYFSSNGNKYCFRIFSNNINLIKDIYNLNNYLSTIILIDKIILNKYNEILTEYNNNLYILTIINNKTSIEDLIYSNKVLPTILSRCTVMTLKQEKSNMIDVNDNQILIKLLNNLLIDTEPLIILFNDYYESLFQTKELSLDTLKKISKILQYYIQTNDLSSLSIKSSDINLNKFQLLEIVSIIDEFSVKLQYNVNIKLWLDSLLIKLTEVKNEIFNY